MAEDFGLKAVIDASEADAGAKRVIKHYKDIKAAADKAAAAMNKASSGGAGQSRALSGLQTNLGRTSRAMMGNLETLRRVERAMFQVERRAQTTGRQIQRYGRDIFGVDRQLKSASASAAVFEKAARAQEVALARSSRATQAQYKELLGVDRQTKSAAVSAGVLERALLSQERAAARSAAALARQRMAGSRAVGFNRGGSIQDTIARTTGGGTGQRVANASFYDSLARSADRAAASLRKVREAGARAVTFNRGGSAQDIIARATAGGTGQSAANAAFYAKQAEAAERAAAAETRRQAAANRGIAANAGLGRSLTGLTSGFGTLNRVVLNSSVALQSLFAVLGLREVTRSIMAFERFSNTIKTVSGNSDLLAANMAFLETSAYRIGFSINEVGNSFARLAVAMTNAGFTALEYQQTFEQLAMAGRNFGLTSADLQGVIRALEQSFSKGKFMAEEVRLQLGDRLPIAMAALEAAVTKVDGKQSDLNKRFEEGSLSTAKYAKEFTKQLLVMSGGEEALSRTSQSLAAAFGRLATSFTFAANALGKGGLQSAIIDVTDALSSFLRSAQGMRILDSIGAAARWAADNMKEIALAAAALVGVKLGAWLFTVASGLAAIAKNKVVLGLFLAATVGAVLFEDELANVSGKIDDLLKDFGLIRDESKVFETLTNQVEKAYQALTDAAGTGDDWAENLSPDKALRFLREFQALAFSIQNELLNVEDAGRRSALYSALEALEGLFPELTERASKATSTVKSLGDSADATKNQIKAFNREIDQSNDLLAKFTSEFSTAAENAVRPYTKQIEQLTEAYNDLNSKGGATAAQTAKFRKTLADLSNQAEEAQIRAGDLALRGFRALEDSTRAATLAAEADSTVRYDQRVALEEQSIALQNAVDKTAALKDAEEKAIAVFGAGDDRVGKYVKTIGGLIDAQQNAQRTSRALARELEGPVAQAFENLFREVDQSFVGLFEDIFTGAEDAFDNFADSLKSSFKKMLAQMAYEALVKPIVVNVATSIGQSVFGLSGAAASSVTGAGGPSGMDMLGLGSLLSSQGGTAGIYNSIALSGFGQSLGLSSSGFTAAGMTAAEGGLFAAGGGGGVQLTGMGAALGQGFQASPWGIIGSLGANALGLGGGIGGTIGGIVGSVGGGAAGAALLGTVLGSAAGPIGAIVGSFLGTALGGMFGNSKPSDYTASFQGRLSDGFIKTEDKANDETRESRDQLQSAFEGILETVRSGLGAKLPDLYLDVATGSRDGLRAWLFNLTEDGEVDRASKVWEQKFNNADEMTAGILQELLRASTGLSDNARTVVDSLDFVAAGIDRSLELLQFAENFEAAVYVMRTGTLDLADAIEGQVKASVDSTLQSIRKFKDDTAEAGLNTAEAADATRSYVEIMLGIKTATVDSMTAVQVEWARLNSLMTEIAPLAEEVGLGLDVVTAALERQKDLLQSGFVNAVLARGMGVPTDSINTVLTGFRGDRDTAATLGVTDQVIGTLRSLRDAGLREALSGLDGQSLRNVITYYSTIEKNAPVVAAATELLAGMGEAAGYLTNAQITSFNEQLRAVETYLNELERVNETWRNLGEQLRDTRLGLRIDENLSPFTGSQRLSEARIQFDEVTRQALLGDQDAIAKLPASSQALLEASKSYYATSEAYFADFNNVQDILAQVEALTGRQVDRTQQQLEAAQAQLTKLDQMINGQDLVVTSIEQATAVLSQIEAALAGAASAAPGGSGANDNDPILGAVARNVDAIISTYRMQRDAAGGPSDFLRGQRDEQIAAALSGLSLEQKKAIGALLTVPNFGLDDPNNPYRKVAGYADGGYAQGLAMVGERGQELVDFETPARVYSNERLGAALRAADREDDAVIELREVKAQLARLTQISAAGAQQITEAVREDTAVSRDRHREERAARASGNNKR